MLENDNLYEDLDRILKIYQQLLEDNDSPEEKSFIEKYHSRKIETEQDKRTRLIMRFISRISEMFDVYAQKKRIQRGRINFADHMKQLQETVKSNAIGVTKILRTILNQSRAALTVMISFSQKQSNNNLDDSMCFKPQIAKIPSWYKNSQDNKNIFSFYENKFTRLYDVVNYDRNYMDSVLIMHQSKSENSERLYQQLVSRNDEISCKLKRYSEPLQFERIKNLIERRRKQLENERLQKSQTDIEKEYVQSYCSNNNKSSTSTSPVAPFRNSKKSDKDSFTKENKNIILYSIPQQYRQIMNPIKVKKSDDTLRNIGEEFKFNSMMNDEPRGSTQSNRISYNTFKNGNHYSIHRVKLATRNRQEEDDLSILSNSPVKQRIPIQINKTMMINFPELNMKEDRKIDIIHSRDSRTNENSRNNQRPDSCQKYHRTNAFQAQKDFQDPQIKNCPIFLERYLNKRIS